MRTHTPLNAIAFVVLSMAVGCEASDDGQTPNREPTREELEAIWEAAQPMIDEELAKEERRSAAKFPCTLYDKEAAGDLFHTRLEAPSFASERKTHDADSWQAEACSWNSWGDGPSMSIWVSRPTHFTDGRVRCIGMDDDDITDDAYGGRSLWFYQGAFAWAKLLVCRDDALFEVELHDGPTVETEARELVDRIARHLVDSL